MKYVYTKPVCPVPQNVTTTTKKKNPKTKKTDRQTDRLHQNHFLAATTTSTLKEENNKSLSMLKPEELLALYFQPDQLIFSGTSALRLFRGQRNSRQLITKPLAVWLA